jgi:hypothetical protein
VEGGLPVGRQGYVPQAEKSPPSLPVDPKTAAGRLGWMKKKKKNRYAFYET